MCELGKMHTVLFTEELFGVFAQLAVVQLESFVVRGGNAKFARVVKVERRDFGSGVSVLEGFGGAVAGYRVADLEEWGWSSRHGGSGGRVAARRKRKEKLF